MSTFQAIFFVFLTTSALHVTSDPVPSEDLQTLQLVHVIFRHGNRTPLPESSFPTDPNRDAVFYPHGNGELNFEGKINAYQLGLEIRERYDGFLPEVYYPPDIKAYSSNTSRTQMSLQSVLTAMFPPTWPFIFLPYMQWQPISYDILPDATDNILRVSTLCPSVEIFPLDFSDDKARRLYEYLEENSGRPMKTTVDVQKVYDTLLTEKENGLTTPEWAEDIINNGELEQAAFKHWQNVVDLKLRMGAGGIIKKITEDSRAHIEERNRNRMILYSGHDLNIALLLGAFDAYDMAAIEYTSHIFIELHRVNDQFGFKVFYKNGPSNPLVPLKFRKCTQELCTMDDFIESTSDLYIPEPQCE